MAYYIYVDNSNVWIEGKRVSAVKRQYNGAKTIAAAMRNGVVDHRWNFHFGRLRYFAGGDDVASAKLYGSRPPPNDELWKCAKRHGFKVIVFDRSFGKEKRVDTQMVADIVIDLYTCIDKEKDTVVIIAGDQDHVPALETAQSMGVRVEVAFWNHYNHHLKNGADEFLNLTKHFDHLSY